MRDSDKNLQYVLSCHKSNRPQPFVSHSRPPGFAYLSDALWDFPFFRAVFLAAVAAHLTTSLSELSCLPPVGRQLQQLLDSFLMVGTAYMYILVWFLWGHSAHSKWLTGTTQVQFNFNCSDDGSSILLGRFCFMLKATWAF